MIKDILQAALTPAQRKQRFRLNEPEDHILELWLDESRIAVFSQYGTTVKKIRAEADRVTRLCGHHAITAGTLGRVVKKDGLNCILSTNTILTCPVK
ncbi:unnamed protein product [marine sediment metagenome]|uniref:Uncharacterized protein n=1 Tax=marine sediment metagenome TaxID=412755 RepID=X0ZZQ0_9ZZZZ